MKVKPVEFNGMNADMVLKLQKEVIYLKELLNLKRKGLNSHDIHIKLVSLQEENERLKKNNVPINEVEKLLDENRKMKVEINKLQLNTQMNTLSPSEDQDSNYQMNNSYGSRRFEEISEIGDKKNESFSMRVDSAGEISNKPKYYLNPRNSLLNAGKNLLNSSHSQNSQLNDSVTMRPEVKREKQRILGRLDELERIQKQNEEKLQRELE